MWEINKGVGRSIELFGLKSQYIFILGGALMGVFLLVVILNIAGLSPLLCCTVAVALGSFSVWLTYYINKTYGEYGLIKKSAISMHPKYLSNRKTIYHIFQNQKKQRK